MSCSDKITKLRQEIAYLFLNIEQGILSTSENDGKSVDNLKKKFSTGAKWLVVMENLIVQDEKDNKLASALSKKRSTENGGNTTKVKFFTFFQLNWFFGFDQNLHCIVLHNFFCRIFTDKKSKNILIFFLTLNLRSNAQRELCL